MKFDVEPEIEHLNNENCIFLNRLNEEEYAFQLQNLSNKIISLYNNKKQNLDFIDVNIDVNTIVIERNPTASQITLEEARNALYSTVADMMGEAIAEGRTFTLQDLNNLSIDNLDVSVNVGEEEAIITIGDYAFKIDKEFYLTDVE